MCHADMVRLCSVGDVIDLFMAYLVIQKCRRIDGGLPRRMLCLMYLNILLDFVVGLVPFVGDVADAIFRATRAMPGYWKNT